MMDRREALARSKLALQGYSKNAEIVELLNFLQLSLDEVKSRMVTVALPDFPALQGEARAIENIIRAITRRPQLTQQHSE
jgi:lipopolysaccharide biosynthesis regulator YciM